MMRHVHRRGRVISLAEQLRLSLVKRFPSAGIAMQLPVCLLITASLVTLAVTYPTGAPDFACDTMIPLHGVGPQSGNGGYNVSVNGGSSFTPGKANTVKLSGSGEFEGFLIRFSTSAITATATEGAGSWGADIPSNAQIDCTDMSGVTHTDPNLKGSIEFQWMAPQTSGDIYFHYTVVTDFTTFFTDQVFKASAASVPEDPFTL